MSKTKTEHTLHFLSCKPPCLLSPSLHFAFLCPPAAVSYSWAISSFDGYGLHNLAGGFNLNIVSGSVATTTNKLPQWVLAHAIMMTISWILLLPSGILLVRHRWVYPKSKIGAKATW